MAWSTRPSQPEARLLIIFRPAPVVSDDKSLDARAIFLMEKIWVADNTHNKKQHRQWIITTLALFTLSFKPALTYPTNATQQKKTRRSANYAIFPTLFSFLLHKDHFHVFFK